MEHRTKKCSWGCFLVAPALSLTLLGSAPGAACAEEFAFLDKVFAANKTQNREAAQPIAANFDPRILQLEEAVRDLTRQLDTLQMSLLQMQNRLDVLEGRAANHPALSVPENADESVAAVASPPAAPVAPPAANEAAGGEGVLRLPASIRFDAQGNLYEDEAAQAENHVELPQTESAKEFYSIGYQHMLAGDYRMAEQIFRAFQTRFPDDAQMGDASFWLGEALYGQGRYREAAQVYIDVQRLYQDSPRSPENVLKLGMSMAQLNETQVACKTLNEVPKRYGDAEPAVLKRVVDEKTRLHCP